MERENNLIILQPLQNITEIVQTLENALQLGYPVLIENTGESIKPPIIEPVVYKEFKKFGSGKQVLLSDKLVDVSADFRLYMTCKL
jgi:dynein heavy chain